MQRNRLAAWIPVLMCLLVTPAFGQAVPDSVRYPCRSVHTFYFWAGDFDATAWNAPANSPPRGQLHNTREYDGCVIVERWSSPNGNGMSMAFYDKTRQTWRMVWNDDGNGSNVFDSGEFRDNAMRFTGWVVNPRGVRVMASNVLEQVSPGVIHHVFSISPDSGRTWIVRGESRFTRRPGTGT